MTILEIICEKTKTIFDVQCHFIRSFLNGKAAYSRPDKDCAYEKGCNTAWITNDINTPSYKKERDPKYSTVAHELAHVFCN